MNFKSAINNPIFIGSALGSTFGATAGLRGINYKERNGKKLSNSDKIKSVLKGVLIGGTGGAMLGAQHHLENKIS